MLETPRKRGEAMDVSGEQEDKFDVKMDETGSQETKDGGEDFRMEENDQEQEKDEVVEDADTGGKTMPVSDEAKDESDLKENEVDGEEKKEEDVSMEGKDQEGTKEATEDADTADKTVSLSVKQEQESQVEATVQDSDGKKEVSTEEAPKVDAEMPVSSRKEPEAQVEENGVDRDDTETEDKDTNMEAKEEKETKEESVKDTDSHVNESSDAPKEDAEAVAMNGTIEEHAKESNGLAIVEEAKEDVEMATRQETVQFDAKDNGEPATKKQKTQDTTSSTPEDNPVLIPASAMMSRDEMAKAEEDGGGLKFDVITNDGQDEHLIQLMTLKNIFAKQLPKMPKEYIVRLVFDRNHRSMVILKNGQHVIGGICYRPFYDNHFAEIAFCAINAADQVKGYGTRLMNHLKEYVKQHQISHFLTYADNYAIGYFKKQGFAKVVSMPRANWFGYIKDYDGGTLMECVIHHQIDYLRLTSMLHQQRKAIQKKIEERSKERIVYSGLKEFMDARQLDVHKIPGVKEAGWSQATIRNNRFGTRDQGNFRTQLMQLWRLVNNHRSSWPFHEPVDVTVVVDYLTYIKEPIDLSLIQRRIENGHYTTKAGFKADLDKMLDNCLYYNGPETNYYKAAEDLKEFVNARIHVR